MTRTVRQAVAAATLMLATATMGATPAAAGYNNAPAFAICAYIQGSVHQTVPGTGVWLVSRTDINWFGHYGVHCVYSRQARASSPARELVELVYDRHNGIVTWL